VARCQRGWRWRCWPVRRARAPWRVCTNEVHLFPMYCPLSLTASARFTFCICCRRHMQEIHRAVQGPGALRKGLGTGAC
jgi:hypothetical protein